MQIFTGVIRAYDMRLGSDSRRATAAGRPRRSKCTRHGSLVTHGSPKWHSPDPTPPPSVLGLGGRKLRPLTATTTRRHGLGRAENDRAGASASHRFHRADSLRDSMY